MKGTKLLLSFWLSTAAFCLLQILFGPTGITETDRLRVQKARLEVRLSALKAENLRLTGRYEALRTSVEAVRLEARSLGWFRPDDVPVRVLDGAEFHLPSEEPDLSTVPALIQDAGASSLFFRLAWPLLFALFLAFFHLWGRMWPSNREKPLQLPVIRNNLPPTLQTGLDFFRK